MQNTILMINELHGDFEVWFIYNLITAVIYFLLLLVVLANNDYSQLQLLCATFVITLVLVLAENYLFQKLGNSYFISTAVDPIGYDRIAKHMVNLSLAEKVTYIGSLYNISDFGYPIYLSYIYSIIESPLFANIINVFINLWTVLLLFKVGSFFLSKRYAFMGAFIYGISQYTIYFVSSGLKETIMVFFIIASMFFYLKYLKEKKMYYIIYALMSALMLLFFRIPLAIFLLVSFSGCELTKNKNSFKKYVVVISLSIFIILLFQSYYDSLLRYTTLAGNKAFIKSSAGTQKFAYVTGFFTGFFGPFPTYMPFGGRESIASYSASLTLYVYLTLPFLYASYWAIRYKKIYMKPLVFYSFFEIAGLVFVGDAFELRVALPHVPFVILLALYAFSHRKHLKKGLYKYIITGYYVSMTCILFMWNYLRL